MAKPKNREPGDDTPPKARICEQCGEETAATVPTTWGQLCPKCNFAHIRAVASAPEDLCTEPGCTLTVAEHIAKFQQLVDVLSARMSGQDVPDEWRSRPSLLERMGAHKPRNRAVAARLAEEAR